MDSLNIDLITFHPFKSAREWKARYHGSVRVSVEWTAIPSTGVVRLLHANPKRDTLWLPWYRGGSWRTGTPKKVKWVGEKFHLVRVPAVKLVQPHHYLLLDGCHRLTTLDPCMLYLDVYYPTLKGRRAFTDLQNWYWRGHR